MNEKFEQWFHEKYPEIEIGTTFYEGLLVITFEAYQSERDAQRERLSY